MRTRVACRWQPHTGRGRTEMILTEADGAANRAHIKRGFTRRPGPFICWPVMSEPDDPLAIRRKRLLFRSRHRGSREMDLLLGRFAERHLPTFSDRQLALFEDMLEHGDPDLYAWLAGRETPPAAQMHDVMKLFLNFKYHD